MTLTVTRDEKMEILIPADPTIAVESGTVTNVSEAVSPLSPHSDPFVPLQDRQDDDKCVTDDTDGPLLNLPHSRETRDHVQPPAKPEEQGMLANLSQNELYQSNTSLDEHLQPPGSHLDKSAMRSTGYALSATEPEVEVSRHTPLRKGPLRPLAENTPMAQASLTAKHKIRRTFSMPVSENSIFFETPLKDAGPLSTRMQKQRLNPVASDRGKLAERQSSFTFGRIASPLGIGENRGTSITEFRDAIEAIDAIDAKVSCAKGLASGSHVVGEDEDVQMHSCNDVCDGPPSIAEEGAKRSFNPEYRPHHEASATENHEAQIAIPPMPDVSS